MNTHRNSAIEKGLGEARNTGALRSKGQYPLRSTVAALALFLCASCTLQKEEMYKGHSEMGTAYKYVVFQVGGQGAFESSSGTKAAVNNEKSFADVMQTFGIAFAGWTAAGISKAKEITAQLAAKEITRQQAAQQLHALQMAELAAQEGATSQAIGAGAEIAPITLTPP